MFIRDKSLHRSPLSFKSTDGMKALTANHLLFQFAVGMVGAFGIIFLFQLGVDLISGLFVVVTYVAFQRIIIGLIIPFIGHITSRVGYRRMMLVGVVMLAIKLYLLSISSIDNLLPLILSTAFGAISITSYYLSYHALFLDDNDDKRIGEQIGKLDMLGRLSTVVSPFIGGLLVQFYGFSAMFMVAMLLMVGSAIPLLFMKSHPRHKGNFSFSKIWEFIASKPRVSGSMFSWSFTDGLQGIFWPILLFLVLSSYALYGLIGSITMLVSAVSIYFVGRIYDKRQAKNMFVGSSVLVSITWIGRFASSTILGFVVSDIVNRLFSPPWWMKIRRQELVEGEKVDSLVFGAAHEYIVTVAYLTAVTVGFTLLTISNGNWSLLAIPAVGGTLLATWLVKDK